MQVVNSTVQAVKIAPHGLSGDLVVPERAEGIVVFAHGSGSGRHSPRNQYVAGILQQGMFATLLLDLLTDAEEQVDLESGHLRFDIGLLARRLLEATDWLQQEATTGDMSVGYFGASTGAGAALVAAADRPSLITRPALFLAKDSPADVYPIREALKAHSVETELLVFEDGESAMSFLQDLEPL